MAFHVPILNQSIIMKYDYLPSVSYSKKDHTHEKLQVHLCIGLVVCDDNSVLDWTIGLIGLELNVVFSLSTGTSSHIHLLVGDCWTIGLIGLELNVAFSLSTGTSSHIHLLIGDCWGHTSSSVEDIQLKCS